MSETVTFIGGPKHGETVSLNDASRYVIQVPNHTHCMCRYRGISALDCTCRMGREIRYEIARVPFGTERIAIAHPSWLRRSAAVDMLTDAILSDNKWRDRL